MLEKKEINRLAEALSLKTIDAIESIHGGDINEAFKLRSGKESYFLKRNTKPNLPGLFEAEVKGLQLLASANCLRIPKVIDHFTEAQRAYLLLEFLEEAQAKKSFWQDFAHGLAKQHQVHQSSFGLDHNNYIGSLQQSNNKQESWYHFFIMERLEPMLKMAIDKGRIPASDLSLFDRLFGFIHDFFPEEKASLLHGDLWNGNFMADSNGEACIYDPAVYFGHREMDVAMTKLFGGFDKSFYEFYNEFYPLEKDWEERIDIANLYPLLVHVNLFGGSYYQQVRAIIKAYC